MRLEFADALLDSLDTIALLLCVPILVRAWGDAKSMASVNALQLELVPTAQLHNAHSIVTVEESVRI